MADTTQTPSVMHTDHRHWRNENDVWRRDTRCWQQECDAVLAVLDQCRQIIQQHGEALKTHLDSINSHEAALELHERTMAQYETKGKRHPLLDATAKSHEQQAIEHLSQRQMHERIKREQHAVVAQLEMLKAAAAKRD